MNLFSVKDNQPESGKTTDRKTELAGSGSKQLAPANMKSLSVVW